MILYNKFKPKKITLSDTTGNIKLEAFLSSDGKHMYPILFGNEAEVEKSTRWAECTHLDCEECGTILEKREAHNYIGKLCRHCYNKKVKEKYFNLPKVSLIYPIFIEDKLIMNIDELKEFLEENEKPFENLEVHNSEICEFKFDILETLEEHFYSEAYSEDNLIDVISSETYKKLEALSNEMITLINENTPKYYYPIETSRIDLEEYLRSVE
jgi:hypothetical protein